VFCFVLLKDRISFGELCGTTKTAPRFTSSAAQRRPHLVSRALRHNKDRISFHELCGAMKTASRLARSVAQRRPQLVCRALRQQDRNSFFERCGNNTAQTKEVLESTPIDAIERWGK
jgi:ribosomal 50S subunit-associated protein YjgA (DUF615 family)